MSCLQNDILIDKLQFSFSQNQTGLYGHIDANYDIFLQNHNRSFRKHYEHHVLEFNPSFNLNTMHNLENITEAELKANIFNLLGIHQNISKDRLKALLRTPIYNSIRLTRLHITRDFVCTHGYKTYYDSNKMIDEKILKLGDSVLTIYDGKEFFNRIDTAINNADFKKRAYGCSAGRVKYTNIKNSFVFDPKRKFFLEKDNEYSYQSELRLLLSAKDKNSPFILKIGSIKDIACIVETAKFKNEYRLNTDGKYDFYLS